ncbi:MAG: alkaline phosphatase family protein, partial [Anaerolineales bacterium]|nr:alkaline phosphatase family protein [Anaerolineales bacterium]
ATHGLVGLNLFFPQFGTVGQMLSLSPTAVRVPNSLVERDGGLDPQTFLAAPAIAEQFKQAGVVTYAYKPYEIIDSVLSKMHGRGVEKNIGVVSLADMLQQIKHQLEQPTSERLFISAYWPVIDTLSHVYGPHSPNVTAELNAITHQLQTLLLDALSPAAWQDTAICLVADHGQINMPHRLFADDYPDLQQLLLIENSGEPRTPYLYARQGQQTALRDYLRQNFSEAMVPLTAVELIEHGLLGPHTPSPVIAQRLGDVIPLMRDGWGFVPTMGRKKIKRFLGMHGGLTPDEMRVPWLVWRK